MVSNLNDNVIIKHINRWELIVTAMLFLMLFAGFGLLYIAILQEVKQSRIAIKVAAWATTLARLVAMCIILVLISDRSGAVYADFRTG